MTTGRNQPWPCGCGRKYKICQRDKQLAAEIQAAKQTVKRSRKFNTLARSYLTVASIQAAAEKGRS